VELEVVLLKTDKGLEELRRRNSGLPPRLRSLLFMVDGRLRVTELIERARSLGGGTDLVEQLLAQGLVQKINGHAVPTLPLSQQTPPSRTQISQAKTVPLPIGLSAAEEARRVAAAKAEIQRRVKLYAGIFEGRPLLKAASSAHSIADIRETLALIDQALSADRAEVVADLHQAVRQIIEEA
jgi:hypothetical protein